MSISSNYAPLQAFQGTLNPADSAGLAALQAAQGLASALFQAPNDVQGINVLNAIIAAGTTHAQAFTTPWTPPVSGDRYALLFNACNQGLLGAGASVVPYSQTETTYNTMLSALASLASSTGNPDIAANVQGLSAALTAAWGNRQGTPVGDEPALEALATRAQSYTAYLVAGAKA